MNTSNGDYGWERSRQYVPNKRVSTLRLGRWRKMRRSNRRRKSVMAYWWGPILICLLTIAGFCAAAFRLPRGATRPTESPAPAGLQVVYVSAETLERMQRAENVRRQAMALSDEEVGISLQPVLPEPPPRSVKSTARVTKPAPVSTILRAPADAFLPHMKEQARVHTSEAEVIWRMDSALIESGFKVVFPPLPEEEDCDTACFRVELNASGAVVELLRFEPSGPDTAWLQQIRAALWKGKGTSAARGEIRIYRK